MRAEFPHKVRLAAFERANGVCEKCGSKLWIGRFHFDHIVPDGLGGKPTLDNCQVLCATCHQGKTAERDVPQIAKADRQRLKHIGIKPRKTVVPGSRNSKWKKHADGTVSLRAKEKP